MTAIEWLVEKLNAIRLDVDKNVLKFIDKSIEQAKEMEEQQGYSEEEVKRLAFKFYLEMSKQMKVPNNLITENYTNVDEFFDKLNPIKNK